MPRANISNAWKDIPSRQGHDILLEAITTSITNLLRADAIHVALPAALEGIAAAMRLDRMIVTEEQVTTAEYSKPPIVFFVWASDAAPIVGDVASIIATSPDQTLLQDWLRPLRHGDAIMGVRRGSHGPVKALLSKLKVVSVLVVPIMVNGKMWGTIAFEDCSSEHAWTEAEVNILKIFAEFVGTAVTRERYVEELRKANTIVQNSSTILYRLRGEPSFPMIYISQNVSLLGYDSSELVAHPTRYQSFVLPDDKSNVDNALLDMLRKDAVPTVIEYRILNAAGLPRWVENRYAPVCDAQGRLIEVEGIMVDITERKVAEDRIALLARTDVLTGLANRATFNDRLRHAFAACKRGTHPFAVLYLDLDRFKEVNDTRGHPVGDKLLQDVAERLRLMTRETDVVARLGGDEFAILQTEVNDPTVSGTFAAKIVKTLCAPYRVNGNELTIGASVGIALYTAGIDMPETLLTQADQALYRAKTDGRGQYRFYSDEIDLEARDQAALADDLSRAIASGQFSLHFQPQVELSSGRVIGMEASVRWNHPARGVVSDEALLVLADKAGITRVVGQWLLDGACRQLAQWRKDQVDVPVVAVNVSLSHIKSGQDFVRDVTASLARHGLSPGDLELCVTELILAKTVLAQHDVLEELRCLGVCIAIDNFGAQYSSLNYLRAYRVGRLKIARPMVTAAAQDHEGGSMIRAIVGLAQELGIEVVADGVETDEQRTTLMRGGTRAQA